MVSSTSLRNNISRFTTSSFAPSTTTFGPCKPSFKSGIWATLVGSTTFVPALIKSTSSGKGKRTGKGGNRFWKSIGLGFKTPREAIEGTYIDKKCPFTGDVSIRGHIIASTCHSAKMVRTVIVRRDYLHYVKKYQRYKKRHSNILAHISPCFRVKEGDHVTIGLCRPLSKTVRFNVLKVIPAGSSSGGRKHLQAYKQNNLRNGGDIDGDDLTLEKFRSHNHSHDVPNTLVLAPPLHGEPIKTTG